MSVPLQGDFTNIPNFPNLPNLPNLAGLNIQLPIHLNGINLLNPSANGRQVVAEEEKKDTTLDRLINGAAEFAGTAILVFLGCMGCVSDMANGAIPHEQISLTFGLAVMLAVQCFGHISGGHINPAVTVAAAIMGQTPLVSVPFYVVGQFAGGLAGYALLMLVTPGKYLDGKLVNVGANHTEVRLPGVCSPAVNPSIGGAHAFVVEFIITAMLILVCCSVWDPRNSNKPDSVPLRFGFTIAVLAMAAGPYTGANMNPARSFAPALFNGDWTHHWVYWLGPMLGSVVAVVAYRLLFLRIKIPDSLKDLLEQGTPLTEQNKP